MPFRGIIVVLGMPPSADFQYTLVSASASQIVSITTWRSPSSIIVFGGAPTRRVPVPKDSNLLIWSKSISWAPIFSETSVTANTTVKAVRRRRNVRSFVGMSRKANQPSSVARSAEPPRRSLCSSCQCARLAFRVWRHCSNLREPHGACKFYRRTSILFSDTVVEVIRHPRELTDPGTQKTLNEAALEDQKRDHQRRRSHQRRRANH
jgi:hypothetical protein